MCAKYVDYPEEYEMCMEHVFENTEKDTPIRYDDFIYDRRCSLIDIFTEFVHFYMKIFTNLFRSKNKTPIQRANAL